MKTDVSTLQDLLKSIIDIRFEMIKLDESGRANCIWLIGLDDCKGEPQFNYVKYKNEIEAKEVIEYLLGKYNNVKRGEDYGNVDSRIFLYFKAI